jgi:prepilin signal peptidase PulO-like enzyme (type II secretory pathway)
MFGGLAYGFGLGWSFLGMALLGWGLLVLVAIDLECMLLPDQLTLGLLWAGLLFNVRPGFAALPLAVCGAAAGYAFFWGVSRISAFWIKRDALGMGDAKLLAALGAWLGVAALPWVVLLAAFITLIGMLVLSFVGRYGVAQRLPFGPGLAIAGFAVALCSSWWGLPGLNFVWSVI